MNISKQLHIVLAGSGEQTIAAYKYFTATWSKAIKKDEIRISIISGEENYECSSLFGEIISGRLESHAATIPLSELAQDATIIYGDIAGIDNKTKQILVREKSGDTQTLRYDHLVLDNLMTLHQTRTKLPEYVHTLNSAEDTRLLCRQIDLLVKQAAIARNPLMAKNLLRFVVLVKSAKDHALASFIDHYIAARCSRYYSLQAIKPECILVYESDESNTNSLKNVFLRETLKSPRITWIQQQKIQRFTPEAVVLENGSFLAASMIISCTRQVQQKLDHAFACNEQGEIITDKFLRVKNESFIWCGQPSSELAYHHSSHEHNQGKHIARNIMLASNCHFLKPYRKSVLSYDGILYPNDGINSLFGASVRGRISRHIHLLYLLFQLPSAKMRMNGFENLVSHFLWKKTKLEAGLIHYGFASRSNIRAAS